MGKSISDITAIVQTFKRPECIERLVASIKAYYPDLKILINDDSETDKGISYGRNYLVSQVKTPYYLILDDDFIFTDETKIELLLDKIGDYDIVAGALREGGHILHYEGKLENIDGVLQMSQTTEEPLDIVCQFFLAKQEVSGWNESIKIGEHTAFFWEHKDKWKIGYEPKCIVNHAKVRTEEYSKYRDRAMSYVSEWRKNNNLK